MTNDAANEQAEPSATNDPVDWPDAATRTVYDRLVERYGHRELTPRRKPLHELISTILSQRTNAANEKKAFETMWQRYGSWRAIRDANEDDLAEAIGASTYPEAKAPQIKETLGTIIDKRGEPSLEHLRDLSADEGMDWLLELPGVGVKTASLVLLFCFQKPVLPVDTHVHRVSQRVGLIGPKVGTDKAHDVLLKQLPGKPEILYNFHIALLKHGQQLCRYRSPTCEKCPLTDRCDWYQENRASS
ncbi:MAG: endonuclease III [Trueperaceae bacterium]|nr:endonuclease III [Trueperaceae bacterium]